MKTRIRATAVLGLPAVVACCSLVIPTVAVAGTVTPLPASNYTVRHACSAPAPRHAACLALELVPSTAAARAHTRPLGIIRGRPITAGLAAEGAYGLRPQDLHSAYQLPTEQASPQTIGIVDAFDDPTAEQDLATYDQEFGLPACTAADGCFTKVEMSGGRSHSPPPTEPGWAQEIATDIEVAHSVCENCHILLVEAYSASFSSLASAEETAAKLGATEISNSWGGPECSDEHGQVECEEDVPAFDQQGIVITAAAGDEGYLGWDAEESSEKGYADYPASSPHVVAVGGTRLSLGPGSTWAEETVWNGDGASGGGCSTQLAAPEWQRNLADWSSVGCATHRAVADVSADADPYTGVAVYDSTPIEEHGIERSGWATIGGTSVASPVIASVFALAGGADGVKYPAKTLYENEVKAPGSLHDVLSGSNGECSGPELFNEQTGLSTCNTLQEAAACSATAICLAGPGYDGPSGVGTPDGIAAFQLGGEEAEQKLEKQRKEEKLREEERQREEKKAEEEKNQDGGSGSGGMGGNGSTGGGSSGGGSTGEGSTSPSGSSEAGASGSAGAGQANAADGGQAGEGGASQASGKAVIRLSAFALTPSALLALNRVRPKVSAVGFVFTLSATARVRATLAKRIQVRGHGQWRLLRGALTFAAAKGRDRRRLTNRHTLTPGRYRLTLTPQHGSPRSLTFEIG